MPPYEVLDFFAGAARVSHLSRGLGQSTASFDIGFHHDPSVFDINSPAGLVCLSWEVCFWDTFRHQATNVESKAKVFIKNKLIYLYIYIYLYTVIAHFFKCLHQNICIWIMFDVAREKSMNQDLNITLPLQNSIHQTTLFPLFPSGSLSMPCSTLDLKKLLHRWDYVALLLW